MYHVYIIIYNTGQWQITGYHDYYCSNYFSVQISDLVVLCVCYSSTYICYIVVTGFGNFAV